MHEDISVCSGRAIWCKVVGRLHVTTIQSKKRNRFEQERASRLAHVHSSLRYQARLSDPRYEEMILPDVTENPMYSTDDVWDGAVIDELDDRQELDTRMGDAEANDSGAEDDDMEQGQGDSQEQDDSEEHARLRSFLSDFE
jgi:hypothetical protein